MLVTVIAIMCSAALGCQEEIVTDSTMTLTACQMGQPALAAWKAEHPIFHGDAWHLERWKCVPGAYVLRGRA